ncbi:RNA-guided endonuclease InsQ/TnpB family protein [Coleofasciculus sp. E2-BRE-01]|uniref:RNA-guided endonuclease InsQ/TnpB family protein n=1 Tax=Coleofasciculus sp. E2-BRE-01 TaxID=3069524 RepID=UPI0033024B04
MPSSTSSVADCTEKGSTSLLSRKIRVYPEIALAKTWFQWMSAARWCFNQAIAILKTQRIGKYDLRKTVMSLAPEWVNQTPYNPRQLAVFQAYEAHKSARSSGGDAKFRSVREPVKSIRFQKDNWKKGTFYPTQTKGLEFKASEPIVEKMYHEPTLVLDRGRWFICYAIDVPKPEPLNSQLAIALDPGVRTFLTGFDGSEIWEIGKYDMGRIYRLACHLDKLMSRVGLSKGRQFKRLRYRLRKAAQKIRVKIRDLVDELHKKAANYLCTKYHLIFLPGFEVKNMVKRGKRRLTTKTARKLVTWSHYRFKISLKHQAAKYGCVVVDVTEEYTSKTCSKCGNIHTKLGGNKQFVCPSCGHAIGRDINGAFNILLKALRDTSTSGVIASFQIVPYSETSGNCQIFPG